MAKKTVFDHQLAGLIEKCVATWQAFDNHREYDAKWQALANEREAALIALSDAAIIWAKGRKVGKGHDQTSLLVAKVNKYKREKGKSDEHQKQAAIPVMVYGKAWLKWWREELAWNESRAEMAQHDAQSLDAIAVIKFRWDERVYRIKVFTDNVRVERQQPHADNLPFGPDYNVWDGEVWNFDEIRVLIQVYEIQLSEQ